MKMMHWWKIIKMTVVLFCMHNFKSHLVYACWCFVVVLMWRSSSRKCVWYGHVYLYLLFYCCYNHIKSIWLQFIFDWEDLQTPEYICVQSPSPWISSSVVPTINSFCPFPSSFLYNYPVWEVGVISFGPFIILIHPIISHIFLFGFTFPRML